MMITRDKRARISPALAFVLLAGISCQISCAKHMANFRKMEIDPTTLKLRLRDELALSPVPPTSEYYFRFLIGSGRYTVDHLGAGGRVRYNAFFVGADDTITTKTKYQVLLSGPFGTVYGESTYFYDSSHAAQPTTFFTELYFNDLGSEPFQLVSALPAAKTLHLSAISVIRIFHAPPEFLVVSANYAPDGHLESMHVNGSKHGDWVHSNEVHSLYPELDVATLVGDRPKTREHFGIPAVFPVKEYQRNPSNIVRQVELKSALDIVNFHYERNLWVQQDSSLPDGTHKTRFLTYATTSEDETLEPIDGTRLFGQFQSAPRVPSN
jgi:hypothetical protein